MLDPRGRQLLLESLRPPEGYRFDCAVGTTFALDLIALLTTPLAFAMFDWEDDEGRLAADPALSTADPLALLESLRRCADRIHVYCQAGQIKVPPTSQRLLTHLEQSVIEVQAPAAASNQQAVFHPKVWAVRFIGTDSAVRYRLLCLSRNLTFDSSWDTVVRLDGELTARTLGFGENRPLGEFFQALPSLASRPQAMTPQALEDTNRVAKELRVVAWEIPDDFEEIRFHPIGLGGKETWPFPERIDRLLVVAPFVTENFLNRMAEYTDDLQLVSRAESLCEIRTNILLEKWKCFTVDDGVDNDINEAESQAARPADDSLTGLHAKAYVLDTGWDAHIFTGSANATTAAFAGNVEFLLELIGKKSKVGVNATIGEEASSANLRSMLAEYTPGAESHQQDTDLQKAETLVESQRRQVASLPFGIRIESEGTGVASVLECSAPLLTHENVAVRCRPTMLSASDFRLLENGQPVSLRFGPHAIESISSFMVFEVSARVGEATLSSQFVLNLPMTGAPPDRRERLLRDLLKDSSTLLRFVMMLLSDDPEQLFEDLRESTRGESGRASRTSIDLVPLLEQLLRALHRWPEKLDQVERLINDLTKTPEGQSLLPPELNEIWAPIARVRAGQRALLQPEVQHEPSS